MQKSVLVLVADGVEELEMVAPVDLLRRAGALVVIASMSGSRKVKSRGGLFFEADDVFTNVECMEFDCLLIPGGPAVKILREEGVVARVAADFFARHKMVAAICAAPLVLKDAGLLEGVRFTAHYSTQSELPAADHLQAVVDDGRFITSRGAGTAVEFALALVGKIFGVDERECIARDIMYS